MNLSALGVLGLVAVGGDWRKGWGGSLVFDLWHAQDCRAVITPHALAPRRAGDFENLAAFQIRTANINSHTLLIGTNRECD